MNQAVLPRMAGGIVGKSFPLCFLSFSQIFSVVGNKKRKTKNKALERKVDEGD